jgi:hypothetical protein
LPADAILTDASGARDAVAVYASLAGRTGRALFAGRTANSGGIAGLTDLLGIEAAGARAFAVRAGLIRRAGSTGFATCAAIISTSSGTAGSIRVDASIARGTPSAYAALARGAGCALLATGPADRRAIAELTDLLCIEAAWARAVAVRASLIGRANLALTAVSAAVGC